MTRALVAALALGLIAIAARAETEEHHPAHDYPTAARADYVIGCLAANGFSHDLLEKCSCGIDTIADMMSYDDYEKAETILSMQQGVHGPQADIFRHTPIAIEEIDRLHRAEAEVNLRCR
ncbi:hypothetical protein [Acidibrevibacterium fodinaquatile]|jgi:hypothetical protein|uniref:hypothetical protein n=1 Tax=Acidibrevibacterium fodinaquatile TaxID=1969806 RepID=UPI000E0DD5AC|nr:hypothetical protein [Acidibrevibacterium fodinaquatile]